MTEIKRIDSLYRGIESVKIYSYLKSYICFPSFDELLKRQTRYSDHQIKKLNLILTYKESKTKALEECKEAISFLVNEGFNELNETLFELGLKEELIQLRKNEMGNILKIDNYVDNVKALWENKPFFYDKAKIFWMWDIEQNRWKMIDETDVLITIDEQLGFAGQLVTGKIKANYLEAFRQVGRIKEPKEFPKDCIQFKDKIFNLTTKEISEANGQFFCCNPIPWNLGTTEETPIMDKLFEEWVGKDYVSTLYEIIAYCCLTDYPIHLIFCLVGSGRNGKTQFQKVVQKFIGLDNICSTELDLLIDNRFESAKMFKKLVCTLGETNFGIMEKTSLLKKLSGGDLVGYEFKNKNPFEGFNYAKIIINSNSLPSSLDTSDGFYRRWLVIDFPNEFNEGKEIVDTIPEQEYQNLAYKVTKILPQILERGNITNQGTIEERRRAYIMASNPLPFFIDHFCVREPMVFISRQDLYNAYTMFLSKRKKRNVLFKEFNAILLDEGLVVRRTHKNIDDNSIRDWFIDGVALRENWQELIEKKEFCPVCPEKPAFLHSFSTLVEQSMKRVDKLDKVDKSFHYEEVVIGDEVKNISIGEVCFHLRTFGKEGMMPIEQLKEDLKIEDKFIEKLKQDGVIFEPQSGFIKVL